MVQYNNEALKRIMLQNLNRTLNYRTFEIVLSDAHKIYNVPLLRALNRFVY